MVALLVLFSLERSFSQPQVQEDLNSSQVDLTLQASWLAQDPEPSGDPAANLALQLVGKENLQEAPKEAEKTYEKAYQKFVKPAPVAEGLPSGEATKIVEARNTAKAKLQIRLGLLKAEKGDVQGAMNLWKEAENVPKAALSAQILRGLYSSPARIYPASEQVLSTELKGWYRDKALVKLYALQSRTQALVNLKEQIQTQAENQLKRLALIGSLPLVMTLIGLGVLSREAFLWRRNRLHQRSWNAPWDLETTCLVLAGWITLYNFLGFSVSQSIQSVTQSLPKDTAVALAAFTSYGVGALLGILLINFLIWRPFKGRLQGLFNFDLRAIPIGFATYFAAVPVVILAATINEKLIPQGGGGNPVLTIITGSENIEAKVLLFLTVAVLAPLFEETLFRGMLYPALASRMSPWLAIPLTSFIFAACHFSAAELIPLTLLGMVMTYTYHRTKNLVPSMVLHSLWNGGSFLALLVLGGST
jgi:membrane protease YdiL (CAAX protease family)